MLKLDVDWGPYLDVNEVIKISEVIFLIPNHRGRLLVLIFTSAQIFPELVIRFYHNPTQLWAGCSYKIVSWSIVNNLVETDRVLLDKTNDYKNKWKY